MAEAWKPPKEWRRRQKVETRKMARKKQKEPQAKTITLQEFEAAGIVGALMAVDAAKAKVEYLAKLLLKRYGMPPGTNILPLARDWSRVRMEVPQEPKKPAPPPPPAPPEEKKPADQKKG